jgi:hypothetical protein
MRFPLIAENITQPRRILWRFMEVFEADKSESFF